jgi:phage-related protein
MYLCAMKRKINTYGGYFERFIETLSLKELVKLNYIISLLETIDRMPVKFIKYVRDGLYELRMEYEGNTYRVFFIFDNDCIVVLFNGFQKKTEKTSENEIDKALRIKEKYYADKRSSNT